MNILICYLCKLYQCWQPQLGNINCQDRYRILMASNCRLLSATLVLLLTLDHSQAFLRSYRNSRTWGTGRQGRRLTNNRARVGRQQLDVENDLSGISPVRQCGQCSASDTETGVVCGTDGKNYQNLCQLKQISCKFLRRQGSTKLHRNGRTW